MIKLRGLFVYEMTGKRQMSNIFLVSINLQANPKNSCSSLVVEYILKTILISWLADAPLLRSTICACPMLVGQTQPSWLGSWEIHMMTGKSVIPASCMSNIYTITTINAPDFTKFLLFTQVTKLKDVNLLTSWDDGSSYHRRQRGELRKIWWQPSSKLSFVIACS